MNRRLFQYLFGLTHPTKQTTAGGFGALHRAPSRVDMVANFNNAIFKNLRLLRISAASREFFPIVVAFGNLGQRRGRY